MANLIQPSFAKGEIAPALFGRVDTAMYRVALRRARNVQIHPYGGASNRPGTIHIGPVKIHEDDGTRLVPFEFGSGDQYVLEFGDLYMRVIREDGHVLETAQNIVNITLADPVVVEVTGHGYSNGDEVFFADVGGTVELNGRRFKIQNVTANTFELVSQIDGTTTIDGTGFTPFTTGGTVARIFELVTPYALADLEKLKFVQSFDVITITHPDYEQRDLTRIDHDNWQLNVITFAPSQVAPTGVTVTPAVAGTTTYEYAVTALADENFEESLPATGSTATGNDANPDNTVSWTAAAGAVRYVVYRKQNGLFGFIGETEDTSFIDNNITPDLASSPPSARNPFLGADNFPGASGYFEQRQVYGGSNNQPDTSFYSKIGLRTNMSVSFPLQPDDAITAALNSDQVNRIEHYVPGSDLLILTNDSEWRITAGSDSAFTFETIRQKPQTRWGSSFIQPERAGSDVLFVERGRARIRNLSFSFQINGLVSDDLTKLASHLFADIAPDKWIVRDMAFANFPEPRLHVVRTDGVLCCMTYDPAEEVLAWARWDTRKGFYESVAVLRRSVNAVEDGVYFLVRRKINNTFVRHIERLHSRKFADVRDAFFLDDGISIEDKAEIASVSSSGDLVITTTAPHGFVDGDIVEFRDIVWEPIVGEDGGETQPDFLNNRRFRVVDATSLTFKLECDEVV